MSNAQIMDGLALLDDLKSRAESERTALAAALKETITGGDYDPEALVDLTVRDKAVEQGITEGLLMVLPYLGRVEFEDKAMTLVLRDGDQWLTRERLTPTMINTIAQVRTEWKQTDKTMRVVVNKRPKSKTAPVVELFTFTIRDGSVYADVDIVREYAEFFTALEAAL